MFAVNDVHLPHMLFSHLALRRPEAKAKKHCVVQVVYGSTCVQIIAWSAVTRKHAAMGARYRDEVISCDIWVRSCDGMKGVNHRPR